MIPRKTSFNTAGTRRAPVSRYRQLIQPSIYAYHGLATMKFSTTAATFAVLVSGTTAFTVASTGSSAASVVGSSIQRGAAGRTAGSTTQLSEKMAEELGTPCEDECAMDSYPNMPPSVHPGVNTGQAMIDLLNHAKENGKSNDMRSTPTFQRCYGVRQSAFHDFAGPS